MPPELKDCVEFTADLAKQLITLSTGVAALMVTYASGSGLATNREVRRAFLSAAISFIGSIVFGLGTLMGLAGQLANSLHPEDCRGIYEPGVRFLAGSQVVLFLLGIGLTIRFGLRILRTAEAQSIGKPGQHGTPGGTKPPRDPSQEET
jgi:hypothetical protein